MTNVNSRREILSKRKQCFNCLTPGHIKKNCKGKLKCYHCQAEVKHHTTFGFSKNGTPNPITSQNNHPNKSNDTEGTSPCLVKNNTRILLLINITEEQFCIVNTLLYTGSQQTFTSDWVVNELKFKPLHQVHMRVSEFLNTKKSNMKLSKYEIVVKSLRTDEENVITALGVSKICTDIRKQLYRFAWEIWVFAKLAIS